MDSKSTIRELVSFILGEKVEETQREEILHRLVRSKTSPKSHRKETFSWSERVSDQLAQVAGSWAFIITFCLVLIGWIVMNVLLLTHPFDAYPFILLNLALSCVAAIQAPIILMSQNRQETKDRQRAEDDYKVNLKSEIILEDMHNKMDELLKRQETIEQRLNEIEKK